MSPNPFSIGVLITYYGERHVTSAIARDPDPPATRSMWCEHDLEQIDHLLRRLHPIHAAGAAGRIDPRRHGTSRVERPTR